MNRINVIKNYVNIGYCTHKSEGLACGAELGQELKKTTLYSSILMQSNPSGSEVQINRTWKNIFRIIGA
jgi:hypothetical protein